MSYARSLGAMVTSQVVVAANSPTAIATPVKNVTVSAPTAQMQTASVLDPEADQKAEAAYRASIQAYQQAIAQLHDSWSVLPTAPYPPSGDNSNFPHSGTPGLYVNQSQVSAAQLAEPGKVTRGLRDQAIARRPKLNGYFFVGTLCLIGYLAVRRSS